MNYQSYCINIQCDTIQAIKYNNKLGVFIDSARLVKVIKKVILADSLLLINKLQENIIKRQEEQRNNSKLIETNFKNYITITDEEINKIKRLYELKLKSQYTLLNLTGAGLIIITGLYFLK